VADWFQKWAGVLLRPVYSLTERILGVERGLSERGCCLRVRLTLALFCEAVAQTEKNRRNR